MTTVKTIRYLPQGGAEVISDEVPPPGAGEVQIKMNACGICAWDLYTAKVGTANAFKPACPGHEGVGRVVALGPDVTGVQLGAKVMGGGFAELRNARREHLIMLPESDLPDEHWVVEPVGCCIHAVDHAHVSPGHRIAVIGVGFMGLVITQLYGRCPVDELVAIDIDPRKLELAKSFGATRTILANSPDAERQYAEVKALGIDTAIDSSGTQAGMDTCAKVVKRGGRILLFGWIHGKASFVGDEWHLGGYTVVNASPFSGLRDTIPAAIRMLNSGIVSLKPLVTHVVSIDEYPELLRRVASGQEKGYIKGVVKHGN